MDFINLICYNDYDIKPKGGHFPFWENRRKMGDVLKVSKLSKAYKKGIYAPKQRRTEEISKILNVSIPWLMGADVPMNPLNLVPPNITDDVVTFPVLGCIAAGYEEVAVEDWNGAVVEVPTAYLKGRDKKDFFVLEVRGNSMYPLYQEKDIVLI